MNMKLYSKGVLFCDWKSINEHRLNLIEKLKELNTTSTIFQQLNLAYISQGEGRDFIVPKPYNEEDDNVSSGAEGKD